MVKKTKQPVPVEVYMLDAMDYLDDKFASSEGTDAEAHDAVQGLEYALFRYKAELRELVKALHELVELPEYDGSPKTSARRLRIKNRARRLVKENRVLIGDLS